MLRVALKDRAPAGLRKGELRVFRKADIDWSTRAIWVRRSGMRDTTKGGHEDAIPIHPDLEPVLRQAVSGEAYTTQGRSR